MLGSQVKPFRLLSNIRMASLFTGVGGLDSGFLELGAELVFACDTDAPARKTYQTNFKHRVLDRSVDAVVPDELKGIDLIVGGPPCQGFSSLGRRDDNDKRNDLILATARLISKCRPKAFVIENVTGITWLANGKYLSEVLSILRDGGLVADSVIINSDQLGIPQRRRRVLIVGGCSEVGLDFIDKIKNLSTFKFPLVTVREVLITKPGLGNLTNHEVELPSTEWHRKVIASIGPSQKLCDTRLGDSSVHSWDLPEIFGKISKKEKELLLAVSRLRRSSRLRPGEHIGDGRPVHISVLAAELKCSTEDIKKMATRLHSIGYLRLISRVLIDINRKFNGRFKRLPLDGPAPAVVREFAFARNVLHPLEPRALTVRECARLQGFQDDFKFEGNKMEQFKQVANAFPPPISRMLALRFLESLGVHSNLDYSSIAEFHQCDQLLQVVSQ